MTAAEIDEALAARGIHLDPWGETFMDGRRVLDWEEVQSLLPAATEDEISSWMESKAAALRRAEKGQGLAPVDA